MALKSYLTLNYNCSNFAWQPAHFEKKKKSPGHSTEAKTIFGGWPKVLT